MENRLTTAIGTKLHSVFGDGFHIYDDTVRQEFRTPCFFVKYLSGAPKPLPSQRYRYTALFNIRYFSSETDGLADPADMGLELSSALEYVTLPDGETRGTQMHWEVQDGVLHFFVNYNYTLRRIREEIPMEELAVRARVEGGKNG